VHFTDADGHKLDGEFNGEFQVTPNVEAGIGDPFLMPIAANANGFVFQGPGHYSAVLMIDGDELSRWSFKVNAIAQQQAAPSNLPDGPGSEGPPIGPGGAGGNGPADIPRF